MLKIQKRRRRIRSCILGCENAPPLKCNHLNCRQDPKRPARAFLVIVLIHNLFCFAHPLNNNTIIFKFLSCFHSCSADMLKLLITSMFYEGKRRERIILAALRPKVQDGLQLISLDCTCIKNRLDLTPISTGYEPTNQSCEDTGWFLVN